LADRWLPAASDEGLILRVFLLVALGVTSYAGLAYPDVKWLWRRERVDDSVLPAGDVCIRGTRREARRRPPPHRLVLDSSSWPFTCVRFSWSVAEAPAFWQPSPARRGFRRCR